MFNLKSILDAIAGVASPYITVAAAAAITQLTLLIGHATARIKNKRLQDAARIAVLSVEKQFAKSLGSVEKKRIAVDRVKRLLRFVPDGIISDAIEAAVAALDAQIQAAPVQSMGVTGGKVGS